MGGWVVGSWDDGRYLLGGTIGLGHLRLRFGFHFLVVMVRVEQT